MTDYKKYIHALRKCAKEHENDNTSTGHIIVSYLCSDTANLLEELEQQSRVNEVLDKIKAEIEELQRDMLYASKVEFNGIYKILDKYKAESEET